MQVIPENFDWQAYDELPERSKVRPASAYVDDVVDEFYGPTSTKGSFLPWEKTSDKFRVRGSEVTVYAGINGHYKSSLTSQVILSLMRQGESALICSFEMRPRKTMAKLVRQAASTDEPALPYIKKFHEWTDGRLWLYDHMGTCEPRKAIAVGNYACRELGVKHVVFDSLMKVVRDQDDYNGQKTFVGDCCSLALAHGVHVHIVAHANKRGDEGEQLNKFNIKGAGEISDQADNVMLIQRNKRKEEKVDRGEKDESPDLFVNVCKQRHGEFEGVWGFWLDRRAIAFVEHPEGRAKPLTLNREPGEEG